MVKIIETESRMVISKGWLVELGGELLFNGYRVSVLGEEKVLGNGWW